MILLSGSFVTLKVSKSQGQIWICGLFHHICYQLSISKARTVHIWCVFPLCCIKGSCCQIASLLMRLTFMFLFNKPVGQRHLKVLWEENHLTLAILCICDRKKSHKVDEKPVLKHSEQYVFSLGPLNLVIVFTGANYPTSSELGTVLWLYWNYISAD